MLLKAGASLICFVYGSNRACANPQFEDFKYARLPPMGTSQECGREGVSTQTISNHVFR